MPTRAIHQRERIDLIFTPQTCDQARLFRGMARSLYRRGVTSLFAAPSAEIAESLKQEWAGWIADASSFRVSTDTTGDAPEGIGAYDAWRGRLGEHERGEIAQQNLAFWSELIRSRRPRAVVLWNGRDHVFVEAAAHAANSLGFQVICMELGPLRRGPMTVAVSVGGINAAARFRRPEKIGESLVSWEAARLRAAKIRFSSEIRPHRSRRRYVFFPLQVDDDTQIYYYAPHFADSQAMVKAVAAAMPGDVRLVPKLHPLADERKGRVLYEPLLREQDRIAPATSDTLGLIAGADAIVTNNSSAGVEALMLDKQVVVLGEAQYAGRGFTHDCNGAADIARAIGRAAEETFSAGAALCRDRYLYELLFHELVHVEKHPLNAVLSEEDHERLAIRLWDLVQPDALGSDWSTVFGEIRDLRSMVSGALREAIAGSYENKTLVLSKSAADCIDIPADLPYVILEEWSSGDEFVDRDVLLLAPELSPAQSEDVVGRLSVAGARIITNVMHTLAGTPNPFSVRRFNHLPRNMRDELYRSSDYWDYYLTQSGISPNSTPAKETQAGKITESLRTVSPKSVLEYGCGDGRILEKLAQDSAACERIVGVDSSERMLQLARHRLRGARNIDLVPADARQTLPFGDGAFDAAFTCGVLAHVNADDLPKVLSELHRTTRDTCFHWEVFEAHQPSRGEHYTNPQTSLTIHSKTMERFGPIEATVEDARPLTGQTSLFAQYHLNRPLLTVLTLHAVGHPDPACESHDYRNLFVSQEQLEELVEGLKGAGWRFLSLSDAMRGVNEEQTLPSKGVVLTFDDGFASVFENALPVLAEHGIRAAAFIPTDFIGSHFDGNARDGSSGPALPTMTPDQLRELHGAGWDIGAHSASHRCFAALSDDEARRELVESRACLEKLLGCPVTTFAFPYGEPETAFRPVHVDMAREAGYELALTMKPGFVSADYAGIDWPRIGVGFDTTAGSLSKQIASVHRAAIGWPHATGDGGKTLQERVQTTVLECVRKDVARIALYGAGRHTARLLHTAPLWPLKVLGIIDDDPNLRGMQRYGLPIYAPTDLTSLSPDAVLISSDEYEDAIYQRIAPLEANGIRVLRLYADAQ